MYVIVLHQKVWGEGQGECLGPVLCHVCAILRQFLQNPGRSAGIELDLHHFLVQG